MSRDDTIKFFSQLIKFHFTITLKKIQLESELEYRRRNYVARITKKLLLGDSASASLLTESSTLISSSPFCRLNILSLKKERSIYC